MAHVPRVKKVQPPPLLVDSFWPESEDNRLSRQAFLVGAAGSSLFVSYVVGHILDPTRPASTIAVVLPVALSLSIAAAFRLRLALIATAITGAMMLVYDLVGIFSDLWVSGVLIWLGLMLGQVSAAFIVDRKIAETGPPQLSRIAVAMFLAAAAYELCDTAGYVLALWTRASAISHLGFDPWDFAARGIAVSRWISAFVGAAVATFAVWLAWQEALKRTPG